MRLFFHKIIKLLCTYNNKSIYKSFNKWYLVTKSIGSEFFLFILTFNFYLIWTRKGYRRGQEGMRAELEENLFEGAEIDRVKLIGGRNRGYKLGLASHP